MTACPKLEDAVTGQLLESHNECDRRWQVYEFSNGLLDMLGGLGGSMITQIHVTLDDVGSCQKDGISAVCGYVAYSQVWSKFNWRWGMTLQELKRPFLHTAKYLHEFPLADRKITDEDICLILAPFIETVKDTLLAGGAAPVCVITECEAYEQLTSEEKTFVRPPEQNSFEIAVGFSTRLLRNPLNISNWVSIQMDEGGNAPQLYARYEAMKRESPVLKSHLGSLCFCDDEKHPPVQAADMLANVVLKSFRKFEAGKEMPRAIRELTFVDGQPRMHMLRYDLDNLKRLAKLRMDRASRMEMPE